MEHLDNCDALEVEINRFADVLESAQLEARVPGCPDWSVNDLALHLGTVHRWAEHLTANVASTYQSPTSMNLVLEPVDASWIRSGGQQLLDTLRAGDPAAPMWTWGVDQHLGWRSRRQLHETLVHRTDLEAAGQISPEVRAIVAADAIDELLINLERAAVFSPKVREIRGSGDVLRIRTTDVVTSWFIRLKSDGFEISDIHRAPDAELSGPALELLLVLYRRLALSNSRVGQSGSDELIRFWLTHSALE